MKTSLTRLPALAATLFAFASIAQAAFVYTVTDLGQKATDASPAYTFPAVSSANSRPSLNNFTNVAFTVMDNFGSDKAVVYTRATNSVYYLPPLPGGAKNSACDINDNNIVVGFSRLNFSADIRAYAYVPGLGSFNIDHFPSPSVTPVGFSQALRINNAGLVVGAQYAPGPSPTFTYWLRKEGISQLWTSLDGGFVSGTPVDLDNNGNVLYNSGSTALYNSTTDDAIGIAGVLGLGKAINDSGQIASLSGNNIYRKTGPASIYVGTIPAGTARIGRLNSVGHFTINADNVNPSLSRAYVYLDATFSNLTTLASLPGWTFLTADDINNKNEIVGIAIRPDGKRTTYLLRRALALTIPVVPPFTP